MGEAGGHSAASPLSLMSVFQNACPYYMAMGMTYEQFWDGDVFAHKAYRKARKIQKNEENFMAWLQGLYVYNAIADLAPALKAFAKGRAKPYLDEPIPMFDDDQRKREERKRKERYLRIKEKVEAFARKRAEMQNNSETIKEVDSSA